MESYQNKVNLVYHRFSENMGGKDLVAHWERCIQLSAEPFIWLFSDDDLMPADGVERVMEVLSRPHHQRGYFFRFPLAVIDGETADTCQSSFGRRKCVLLPAAAR